MFIPAQFGFFQVLSVFSYFGPFTILTFTVIVILTDQYVGSAWALIQKKKNRREKQMNANNIIYQKNILVHWLKNKTKQINCKGLLNGRMYWTSSYWSWLFKWLGAQTLLGLMYQFESVWLLGYCERPEGKKYCQKLEKSSRCAVLNVFHHPFQYKHHVFHFQHHLDHTSN